MKQGILKRVMALCIFGGLTALTLAACGDSENKDEGEEIVQDVNQEVTPEDEDGTVEVAKNDEAADTVDPSGNDVRVAHASSSGNSGNGFAIPVVKPGEEPDPGEGPQPGEEPKPSAGTQSGTESKQPQQPGTGTQQSSQPQSNTGTQPNAEPQQPQQPQQPSTGTQTVHTHNFQGGNCSTPATCSCGATGNYGSHNWVTKTTHHEGTGHYEYQKTGTEQVVVDHTPEHEEIYCQDCGELLGVDVDKSQTLWFLFLHHSCVPGNLKLNSVKTGGDPIYETRDKWEDVWVQDTAAWDENVTTCSICGAKQ